MHLAERCCAMISQISIPTRDGVPVSGSISVGGTLALPDDTADTLIQRADQLMYRNKTNGDLAKNTKALV
jgi:PleD family two-component response regulator